MKLNWAAWAFVAPALLVIAVFFFLPVLAGFALSFTDFDIYALADLGNLRFVGSCELRRAPANAAVLEGTGQYALLCRRRRAAVDRGLARRGSAAELEARDASSRSSASPSLRPSSRRSSRSPSSGATCCTRASGLLNYGLEGMGLAPIDWLGDPRWAMPAIILFAVWKNFGYNMIIFLAGLQSIPEELYEAARIDGASSWQQLRHVTLPSLAPVVLLVSVLTMAGYFQLFAEPYVMTQGGPLQSTVSVLYFMYEEGFKWWNLGFASAIAFVLFLLMFAVTMLQLYVARLREAS